MNPESVIDYPEPASQYLRSRAINNGFWDRDPEDRASRMEAACERAGVSNFFDLPPEDRNYAYEL